MRRALRWLLVVGLTLVVAAGFAALWVRSQVRASLAQLDGEHQVNGLTAPVTVTRDALGIPTIKGATREDVARATGFLHAQDRFFQMDLARRRAAGELAELVGPRALVIDREIRLHRFRAEAHDAVGVLEASDRRVLDAYVGGVNEGLAALEAAPFEYLLLRQDPARWTAEDSFLVVLSMFVTLQDTDGSYESTLGTMHEVLPQAMFDFMAPRGTDWDTPIVGEPFALASIPGPEVYNLRERRKGKGPGKLPTSNSQLPTRLSRTAPIGSWLSEASWELGVGDGEAAVGSNNFAVAGRLTADGGALVANDMHLGIRVPNTWYRATFEWPDTAHPSEPHRLSGVTLPGVPAMVAGSNTHIAWGFTNTYADWSDIVLLETDPANPGQYRTPHGWREIERHDETLRIAGQEAQHDTVAWTMWGPVLGPDFRGRPRAYRWVAHSAERLAATITPLENARTLEEAFDAANGLGTPGQNFVVADRSGRIGWSVYGAIPRRVGLDGRLPMSWADGTRRWDGWLDAAEYPRVADPPGGRIWTANARVADGDALAKLGDGSYEIGSRARLIRDRLMARDRFTPRDLLAIQLDTRATFLARWRDVILRTLTSDAMRGHTDRAEFRDVVDRTWTGEASPDSAAYRLTRAFRDLTFERVIAFVLAECYEADAAFDYNTERRRDAVILKLVTEQPLHLLDPQYASWQEMLLSTVDATIENVTRDRRGGLSNRVWSEFNVTSYAHPLSAALPLVGRWLDMPRHDLPGDLYTPRVAWGNIGASERMIVSPGRESDGIMHMPTGQSGNPLSPFYANSHDAWVKGEPTPFLPGPAVHTLTLRPVP
jgi:penicillin amidase